MPGKIYCLTRQANSKVEKEWKGSMPILGTRKEKREKKNRHPGGYRGEGRLKLAGLSRGPG